ncbi:MAG: TPR end-of-group domain-containing protein, partial [Hyphomicrobiales bacterium]
MKQTLRNTLVAIGLIALPASTIAQHKVSEINVFQLPEMTKQQTRLSFPILNLFRQKKYAEAEKELREWIEKYPDWPLHHYNLGAALARQGKTEEALDSLEQAITLGFDNRGILARDEDYAEFHDMPRFIELVSRMGTALA